MTITTQEYVLAASIIVSCLILIFCLVRGMWAYRLWTKRGFFLKDYENFSNDLRRFCFETAHVRLTIGVGDGVLDASIRTECMKLVKAADEYETAIQVALICWEDMIHPCLRTCEGDEEEGKDDDLKVRRKLEKKHRRNVIRGMRARCLEGIKKRQKLSSQMHCILNELVPDIDLSASMSGGLPVLNSKINHQKTLHGTNRLSTVRIPDFDLEKKEVEVSERPFPQRTSSLNEQKIIDEKFRNFSLPSPMKETFGPRLAVPARRMSSPSRGQKLETPEEHETRYLPEDESA